MMDPRTIEAVIARRFGLPRAPTLVARVAAPKLPVVFTHLQSTDARRRQTADVPREQSFSFQVPLTPFPWQAWFAGKEKIVPPAVPGNAYLFDLSNNPTVGLTASYGLAIVVLTIVIMALLMPLTIASIRSMLALQRLEPNFETDRCTDRTMWGPCAT